MMWYFTFWWKWYRKSVYAKGSIVDVNNKNDIEKTTASHEQDEDKELVAYA